MLFNSIDFFIFFIIVLLVLYAVPAKFRQVWLLICSYFFYMCWNPVFIVLIIASTLVTWGCALGIDRSEKASTRKLLLAACVIVNLGILFWFKYLNFALDTISMIIHRQISALNIILPVGISFYTFQALGYTIDCYRGKMVPEKNLLRYALFVSFFPQLVAGPIERSTNLLGQLNRLSDLKRSELFVPRKMREGAILMIYGLFVKMVIADRISVLVDNIFGDPTRYGTVGMIMAFFGFIIQIYCDFHGYSTISIGASRIMSIDLMENFNAPLLATSLTDLWRKWHISLSSWFRDYLYIPLGGSRKGTARKYLNLLIVMVVSGLWHGAAWTYVAWGAITGVILIIEALLRPLVHKVDDYFEIDKTNLGFGLYRAFFTMIVFGFTTVFFRSSSFGNAFLFFKRMFTRPDWYVLSDGTVFEYGLNVQEMWILAFALLILFAVDLIRTRKGVTFDKWLMGQFAGFRVAVLLVLIFMIVVFGKYGVQFDSQQFIYFQF